MKKRNTFFNTGRKIIGVLISALITTSVITTPIWAENFEIGDVNQDNKVNSIDMATLRGYLIGMEGFSLIGERKYEADVNGDDSINSIDLAYIRQLLLGNITKLPKATNLPDQTQTPIVTPTQTRTPKPPIGTPTSPPPATPTSAQTYTPPAQTYTPVKTPAPTPNYILPEPSQHPDKLGTKVYSDVNNLETSYLNTSVSFKVFLFDSSNNPLAGKTVSWNWDPNLGEEPEKKESAVTDSSGAAVFTITQNFDENIDYKWWKRFINLYFDGDEEYNASVYQKLVIVSNNGLPSGQPKPLPSPTLDPDKSNTNINVSQDEKASFGSFTQTSTFSVKLVNDNGEPIAGKTVKWVDHGYIAALTRIVDSAVTDSNGVAVFSFSQTMPEDWPFNGYMDVYINLCYEGDDTYNPSVYYTKITALYRYQRN
ncbi:dockerin type I domain-containing protein [Acetivibrio cellulolyticus]|uniref:dockerin type I domain-containing protein n=1 Tax=Acetivibrio cellulolyticus TaxID=35830 RepID=UPI0001E2FB7C|nr:dockerin type I domain-containing protein [Acetivibrio cellulolyticus]